MSHTLEIPKGIEYNATRTMTAMLDHGLKHTNNLTNQCRQIAYITCSKAGIANRKVIRMLTNRLVSIAFEHAEIK